MSNEPERRDGFCDDPLPEGECSSAALFLFLLAVFVFTVEALARLVQ